MKERNEFIVTGGNLAVLQMIPEMMTYPIWRDKLRNLVLEFMTSGKNKKGESK